MIIKTLLLFTVLSIIDKNEKGVHCSKLLSKYLNITYKNFDFQINICLNSVYSFISDLFNRSKRLIPSTSRFRRWKQVLGTGVNPHSVYVAFQLHIRLIRLTSSNNSIFISRSTTTNIWRFHKSFRDSSVWTSILTDAEYDSITTEANSLIKPPAIDDGSRNDGYLTPTTPTEQLEMYNNCVKRLEHLSSQSYFMDRFTEEAIHMKNLGNTPIASLEYGYILLLIKNDEFQEFKNYNDNNQRIFILDIMIEALINIFQGIDFVLKKMTWNSLTPEDYKLTQSEDAYMYVMVNTLLKFYELSARNTKYICNIQEIRSEYPGKVHQAHLVLYKEYYSMSMNIRTKLFNLNDTQNESTNISLHMNVHKTFISKIVNKHRIDRLTTYNQYTKKISMRVSLFEFYPPLTMNTENEEKETKIVNAMKSEDIKQLLELNGWLEIINRYSFLMALEDKLILKRPTKVLLSNISALKDPTLINFDNMLKKDIADCEMFSTIYK